MKNKILLLIFFAGGMFFCANFSEAYQSQIISNGEAIAQVNDPENQKIFYGELIGKEKVFEINSENPFNLYANILVPDVSGARKNFSIEIKKDGQRIEFLDGANFQWSKFYDPFAGDNYWKGPEERLAAGAGRYEIKISNPENEGKFALVIGENKSFTFAETAQSIMLIPKIKKDFFGESTISAYLNQASLLFFGIIIVIAGATCLCILAGCRKRKKKK